MEASTHNHSERARFAVVVNEDPAQVDLLSGLLRRTGLEPCVFNGAEAALAAMFAGTENAERDRADSCALIVTDLYMASIDGWRFCRLLRSPEYRAFNQVPILVVSATFAQDEASRIATDLGVEAFLPSPVDSERFCQQVGAILRGERVRILPRVLIVDDDAPLCELLKEVFVNHGYAADAALTVRAAAELFGKSAYELAVLDYHLPDGPGDVLLDVFRAQRPHCVCLMMTGDTGPHLALDWMKRGAAAYLRKPFEPEYLIELCSKARRERALLRVQDVIEARTRGLRESEEKCRVLLDGSSDHIFSLTPEGHYTYLNRAFAKGVGKPVADIIGKSVWEVFPKEEADKRFAPVSQVFRTGEENVIETRGPQARDDRYYLTTITPIKDPTGKVASAICSSKDITAHKRSEEALRLKNLVFEESIAANSIADLDGVITEANATFLRIWGYSSADEVVGEPIPHFLNDPNEAAAILTALNGTGQWEGDFIGRRKDGSTFIAHSLATIVRDENGEKLGYQSAVMDITERKRAEAETERLEAQNRELQKSESLGRMAGAIAHHFNNQLHAVMMNLDLAMDELLRNSRPIEMLTDAMGAARKAAEISSQMLTYLGQTHSLRQPLDLSETFLQSLPMLRAGLPRDVVLMTDLSTPGPCISANANQMQQVLTNLVTNAWESHSGGCAAVRLSVRTVSAADIPAANRFPVGCHLRDSTYACLEVVDTGCGIEEKNIATLFDPFYSSKFTGRGLGLAVVLGIVRAHEGVITVESKPGRGSIFRIFLPVSPETLPQQPVRVAHALKASGGGVVLVVEDEPAVRRTVTTALERFGFMVLEAGDGVEALEVFRRHRDEIGCVLCDLTMPRLNGWETLTALRRLVKDIPFILASGYNEA